MTANDSARSPIRVGLLGAGPWAEIAHAPLLAAGPETTLAGVWSRSFDKADALARRFPGTVAWHSFDELIGACDAVACCVAPDAQVEYATRAAEAGKPLLLEKPLGLDLAGAQRLVDAIAAHSVPSVVVLTNRFAAPVREFLAAAHDFTADGGRALFVSGALLEGPFAASPWRRAYGALLDVGPHILDLVDAALGPLVAVERALHPSQRLVHLVGTHDSGARSAVTIDCSTLGDSRTEVELFGAAGRLVCDTRTADGAATLATLRREFADSARTGTPHPVDAARALSIERWLHGAGNVRI